MSRHVTSRHVTSRRVASRHVTSRHTDLLDHELGDVLQRAGNLLELGLHQLVIRVILALAPLDLLDKMDFLPPIKRKKN